MADLEKVDERRMFEGSDGETYYIAPPTAEDIRGADWQYSKIYTHALREDIPTTAEMNSILKRRGIIGPEFNKRQSELAEELNNKILELETAKSNEEKQKLAVEVAETREELFQWNQRLNGPMSNTCEQIADDARLEYLTSVMVQTEDGSRVWKSYEDYLREKSRDLAITARFEVMLYIQGFDSDFLTKTPEAVAMREISEELQQEASAIMNAEEEAEEAEESSKSISKKTTSKKKTK